MTAPNPGVEALLRGTKAWQAETKALRSVLRDCGLEEAVKWGKPCFTFAGHNVAIIQGFKASCALMFFQGALLEDPQGVLVAPGANSQAGRRLEFTSLAQVQAAEPAVRTLVAQALRLARAGRRVDFKEKHELELPVELTVAFKKNPKLGAAFRALTPGRQRAYVLHVAGAKQSATRTARIEKCAARILAGKGLADR